METRRQTAWTDLAAVMSVTLESSGDYTALTGVTLGELAESAVLQTMRERAEAAEARVAALTRDLELAMRTIARLRARCGGLVVQYLEAVGVSPRRPQRQDSIAAKLLHLPEPGVQFGRGDAGRER